MMMDAVGEEHPLGIFQEGGVLRVLRLGRHCFQDVFQGMTHPEVVPAVLVPEDVPPVFGGFGQVVGIGFLLQAQRLPAGDAVAHHLQVGKSVNGIFEIVGGRFLCGPVTGGQQGGRTGKDHHFEQLTHGSSVFSRVPGHVCKIRKIIINFA